MMKETNIHSQVTSTIAGDDGEAVAKSEQNAKKKVPEKPNEGLEKPADAGWYVAVVRVNCETRIADSIRINLNHNHVWFDYWIPKVKVVYIDKRFNKRKVKEKLFLSTFIFCNVSPRQLDNMFGCVQDADDARSKENISNSRPGCCQLSIFCRE